MLSMAAGIRHAPVWTMPYGARLTLYRVRGTLPSHAVQVVSSVTRPAWSSSWWRPGTVTCTSHQRQGSRGTVCHGPKYAADAGRGYLVVSDLFHPVEWMSSGMSVCYAIEQGRLLQSVAS